MFVPFERLHFSQSNCKFLAVLLPPFEKGIIWSNSKFVWLPQLIQHPPSLFQTNIFTSSGIGCRLFFSSISLEVRINLSKPEYLIKSFRSSIESAPKVIQYGRLVETILAINPVGTNCATKIFEGRVTRFFPIFIFLFSRGTNCLTGCSILISPLKLYPLLSSASIRSSLESS